MTNAVKTNPVTDLHFCNFRIFSSSVNNYNVTSDHITMNELVTFSFLFSIQYQYESFDYLPIPRSGVMYNSVDMFVKGHRSKL